MQQNFLPRRYVQILFIKKKKKRTENDEINSQKVRQDALEREKEKKKTPNKQLNAKTHWRIKRDSFAREAREAITSTLALAVNSNGTCC